MKKLVAHLGGAAVLFCALSTPQVFAQAGRENPESTIAVVEKQSVKAKKFMLAAANPLAVEAGYKVLEKGGAAIDAAIAVQAMLTLVEPQSSGIGGGAFMLHFDGQQLTTFDGRETAPQAATPDLFLDKHGKPVRWIDAVVGGRSVGTPGVLKALYMAHQKHGKLPWASLFEDAIATAEKGFIVSPRLARLVAMEMNPGLKKMPRAAAYFFPGGKPIQAGDRLKNPEYAASLRKIAKQGISAFYQGELAKEIVKAVQNAHIAPGRLSLDDMKNYQAKQRPAICAPYHEYKVCSMGPPSSGGIAVLQILRLLEPYQLDLKDEVKTWHLFTQASRLAYADRNRYVADSDFVPVPIQGLLNPEYLAGRRSLISNKQDMGLATPGTPPQALALADDNAIERPNTSHMSIVDKYGNAISMTTSIEMGFGSTLMVGGFLLNNQLTDFSLDPRRDGKWVANRVEGGKRPRSSMSPVMVFDKSGKVHAVVGSPGGSRIINYVAQTLIGVLDADLDIQEAINYPRITNRNRVTTLEKSDMADKLKAQLEKLGHKVSVRDLNSGLHGIVRDGEYWVGGADPRREGIAKGQ